jgi:hypothetical protein
MTRLVQSTQASSADWKGIWLCEWSESVSGVNDQCYLEQRREVSDVSFALLLSESARAAAPASPIWFNCRLQRGEEGQGCTLED